jgi:hypothetical protein
MIPNTRNIIIFTSIAAALILIYIFFIRQPSEPTATLVSSSTPTASETEVFEQNSSVAREFLTLLLSVKSIKLNDAIFSDSSFASLRDSSIVLTPDATQGRPNPFAPFAPFGSEGSATSGGVSGTVGPGETDTGTTDTGTAGTGTTGTDTGTTGTGTTDTGVTGTDTGAGAEGTTDAGITGTDTGGAAGTGAAGTTTP